MIVFPCLWLISPSWLRWRLSRPALLMVLSIVPTVRASTCLDQMAILHRNRASKRELSRKPADRVLCRWYRPHHRDMRHHQTSRTTSTLRPLPVILVPTERTEGVGLLVLAVTARPRQILTSVASTVRAQQSASALRSRPRRYGARVFRGRGFRRPRPCGRHDHRTSARRGRSHAAQS